MNFKCFGGVLFGSSTAHKVIRMDNEIKFLLYKTEQENVSVDTLVRDETIWLTQKAMAELFTIDKFGIGRHLMKNIFESGELDEEVAVAKIAIPTRRRSPLLLILVDIW